MTAVARYAPAAGAAPGVPFERLVRVEWRKLSDTRAARWVLAIVALVGLLSVAGAVSFPGEFDQSSKDLAQFAGYTTAILFPAVVILHLTSEFNQRSALFTFTQEPNRLKVLAAKLLVGVWLGVVVSLLLRAGILAGLGVSELLGRDVAWNGLGEQASLGGWFVLNALMATAFAALLQASAPAIVLFYVVPTIWGVVAEIPAIKDVGPYLDTSRSWSHVIEGTMGGHWAELATSTLFWVGVPLVLGALRLQRREIK